MCIRDRINAAVVGCPKQPASWKEIKLRFNPWIVLVNKTDQPDGLGLILLRGQSEAYGPPKKLGRCQGLINPCLVFFKDSFTGGGETFACRSERYAPGCPLHKFYFQLIFESADAFA